MAPCAAFRYPIAHLAHGPVQAILPNRGRDGAAGANWKICEDIWGFEELWKNVLTVGAVEGIAPVDHKVAAAKAREEDTGEQTEDTVAHSGRSLDEEKARGAGGSHRPAC